MPTLAIVFGLSSLLVSKVSKEGPKDVYVKSICEPGVEESARPSIGGDAFRQRLGLGHC